MPTWTKRSLVRFVLENGERQEIKVKPTMTMDAVLDMLWERNGFKPSDKESRTARLMVGEVYFSGSSRMERAHRLFPLFVEHDGVDPAVPELVLYNNSDIGDRQKRSQRIPSHHHTVDPIMCQGVLQKRGKGAHGLFRDRYFVLQRQTLFYFNDEKTFRSQKKANGYVPMGSCPVEAKNRGGGIPMLQIQAEHIEGCRNFQLIASDSYERDKWLRAVYACNLRRAKSIWALVTEELVRRKDLNKRGIFRKSGAQTAVRALHKRFILAERCDLSAVPSPHTLASLLKLSLREMGDPLIPEASASEIVRIVADNTDKVSQDSIRLIKQCVKKLPAARRSLLQFVLEFLRKVASESGENMMTADNLGTVVGPNLMWRRGADAKSLAQDAPFVSKATSVMISNAHVLFNTMYFKLDSKHKVTPSRIQLPHSIVGADGRKSVAMDSPLLPRKLAKLRQKLLDGFMKWETMLLSAKIQARNYFMEQVAKDPKLKPESEKKLTMFCEKYIERDRKLREQVGKFFSLIEVNPNSTASAAASARPVPSPSSARTPRRASLASVRSKSPGRASHGRSRSQSLASVGDPKSPKPQRVKRHSRRAEAADASKKGPVQAIAKLAYKGGHLKRRKELLFKAGDRVTVTDRRDEKGKGWWKGYFTGIGESSEGWFPKSYVRVVEKSSR